MTTHPTELDLSSIALAKAEAARAATMRWAAGPSRRGSIAARTSGGAVLMFTRRLSSGSVVAKGRMAAEGTKPKLVYTIPPFQVPTGTVLLLTMTL